MHYFIDIDSQVVAKTQCDLLVVMLSDKLIAASVTLLVQNIDVGLFLDRLYDRFVDTILDIMPSSKSLKRVSHFYSDNFR
jgi:hypothetical protein